MISRILELPMLFVNNKTIISRNDNRNIDQFPVCAHSSQNNSSYRIVTKPSLKYTKLDYSSNGILQTIRITMEQLTEDTAPAFEQLEP